MRAVITIEDDDEGQIVLNFAFEPKLDRSSRAHEMAARMLFFAKRESSESIESDEGEDEA